MREKTDLDQWKRNELFDFYGKRTNPFYMVTFVQDVTDLYNYAKANRLSFYYAMIWACTKAINMTDAFLYTIEDDEVWHIDRRHPSFTDLNEDGELFHIVTMEADDDIIRFVKNAAEKSRTQTEFIDMSLETDDLIFISCLPWLEMTAMTNARDYNDPGTRNDSHPSVSWGKYKKTKEGVEIHICIEVSHRLVDGVHLGMFKKNLDDVISSLVPKRML